MFLIKELKFKYFIKNWNIKKFNLNEFVIKFF